MASLMPNGKQQFFTAAGAPLVGGKVYTYAAGTSTPKNTFSDAAGTVPNANPIILDSRGEALIYWTGSYKVSVQDSLGSAIYTVDNYVTDQAAAVNGAFAAATGSTLVTHISSASGAVARAVNVKLEEGSVSVLDFVGVDPTGTTDSSAGVLNAIATGKRLFWPKGTYKLNVTVNSLFDWFGDGNQLTQLKPFNNALPVVTYTYQDINWYRSSMTDIGFVGSGTVSTTSTGFSFGRYGAYTTGVENAGRVDFTRVLFTNFYRGVFKAFGNIGNGFFQCDGLNNAYAYYALGGQFSNPASGIMHAGNDHFDQGNWSGNTIAAFCIIDNTGGLGNWTFNGTICQFNPGFGVFASFGVGSSFAPLVFNGFWDETNGTAANVTIDTITGAQVLVPKGKSIFGLRDHISIGYSGSQSGFSTLNPQGTVGIWGNQRSAINLIGGGYGTDYTQVGFSSEGTEGTIGSSVQSYLISGTNRDIRLTAGGALAANVMLQALPNGSVLIGNSAVANYAPPSGTHAIYGGTTNAGDKVVAIGANFATNSFFYVADSPGQSAALTVLSLGKIVSTNRSINAAGTINAAGADYAEYEHNNGIKFNKGDIVGFKADGTLTNIYSEAIRFGIKSTNPSYVGGDTWGSVDKVGIKPDTPVRIAAVTNRVEMEIEGKTQIVEVEQTPAESDDSLSSRIAAYEKEYADWNVKYESARALVDRIAYSGKAPVNLINSNPGDYIMPIADQNGLITGVAKAKPSYEEYLFSVGKVNRIISDGRAEVIVISH